MGGQLDMCGGRLAPFGQLQRGAYCRAPEFAASLLPAGQVLVGEVVRARGLQRWRSQAPKPMWVTYSYMRQSESRLVMTSSAKSPSACCRN
ncbi:hypothetical protein ACFV5G_22865 [Streptomyces sp. NPDC059766]|uniref:hypothetical protein n=1 Tax=Streptomyces sp. NPDC059766 TaxID=3346940 RepID=UPI003660FA77